MDIYENEKHKHGNEGATPLSDAEILDMASRIRAARASKEFELAYDLTKKLADAGHVPSIREWGTILESGELGGRDLDGAMRYFALGARKNDAYSAYRYSRLVGRGSEAAERFWLLFAALLGCRESFTVAAELLDGMSRTDDANYFYSLAADCDNVDAIITLSKRYYEGVGVTKCDAYSRWYMDKLTIPPIYAIKLAYKLRGVKSEEPPRVDFSGRIAFIKRLSDEAKRLGAKTAEIKLCELLSETGDVDATTRLGNLYAECADSDAERALAVKTLEFAAHHGSADAYISLGGIYLSGKFGEPDGELALKNYRRAAELGKTNAYETMANIYCEGSIVKKDIARAAELYEAASAEGSITAREKLTAIIAERDALYRRGAECYGTAPEESFRAFALAVSMGQPDSYAALARAYLIGMGTKPSRHRAFALLKRAYEIGADNTAFPLAMCYLRGIGVKQSFAKAKRLLAEAAAGGDERGKKELLSVLEAKKKKLAHRLYSQAMQLLYMQKFEPALEALLAADSIGHAKSTYTLGCFYEFGLGVECDKDRAYTLYERAFANKFRDPRAAYKLIILKVLRGKIKKPREREAERG